MNNSEQVIDTRVHFRSSVPKCSTAEQYESWKNGARQAVPNKYGFCEDCTLDFQSKMIRARKCENPHVIITDIDD